jgi:hypothetical protein
VATRQLVGEPLHIEGVFDGKIVTANRRVVQVWDMPPEGQQVGQSEKGHSSAVVKATGCNGKITSISTYEVCVWDVALRQHVREKTFGVAGAITSYNHW